MMRTFTLGKKERLKSRKALEALFRYGRSIPHPLLRLIHYPVTEPGLRLGVGVSARHFKKATDRNRIKRLVREGWRLQKAPLQSALSSSRPGLDVFITYQGKQVPSFAEVRQSVADCIEKLVRTLHEDPA